jgi:large subunit ribosomal protein L17
MFRNLTLALLRHERIITTVEKAKELRPFVEKLITLAKKGTLHARRLVIARLGPTAKAEIDPDDDETKTLIAKLFDEIGPRFADRPGGYTRIIKRHQRRLGDAGRTAYIELLKEGEKKVQARSPAPAPRVEPAPATPATPPTPAPAAPEGTGAPSATPQAEQAPPAPEAGTPPAQS